jgi:uncharacterized membrane-anchored protein YjiN (DUF445 family)
MLNSAEQREKINAGVRRILAHSETQDWIRSVWNEICQAALDDLAQPSSRLRLALEKPISIIAQALANDSPPLDRLRNEDVGGEGDCYSIKVL